MQQELPLTPPTNKTYNASTISDLVKEFNDDINRDYIRKIFCLKDYKDDFLCDNTVRGSNIEGQYMFKLLTYEDEQPSTSITGANGRKYEFLVEFDEDDFAYGIYYGCKVIFNIESVENRDEQEKEQWLIQEVNDVAAEWEYLKPQILAALNNTFVYLDFSVRTIPTDNVSRMTYWPFWIRLGENEDVKDIAAVATRIIRNVYREFLKKENYEKFLRKEPFLEQMGLTNPEKRERPKSTPKVETRYTNKDYDSVIKKLENNKGILGVENAVDLFKEFLCILEKEGIIERQKIYEKGWKIKNWSNIDFAELIAEFNEKIRKEDSSGTKKIAWELFDRIIMSHESKPLKDTRKQYSEKKSKESETSNDIKKKIKAIIKQVFSQV